jgi:hypothetical protein
MKGLRWGGWENHSNLKGLDLVISNLSDTYNKVSDSSENGRVHSTENNAVLSIICVLIF